MPVIFCFIIFGAYKLWLLFLYKKSKEKKIFLEPLDFYPPVTIQIPVYNEFNVVERIINSATEVIYPKDKLEIQILDDSTDETRSLVDEIVDKKKREGFDIKVIRREKREGYKAGALKNGLDYAKGEFIAIFDADFIIPEDFLLKTIPFFKNPQVALVQARWGFLNERENRLTKIESMALNVHFEVEHNSKFKNGYFFNFNGSAGIWRKSAILDAGNWHFDTLAEDLDLSVRAYLRGWKFVFLNDLVCPSELPPDIHSFVNQQFRWVKGTSEVGIKLFKEVIKSKIKLEDKINIISHLFAPFLYVANIIFFLLVWPLSHFSPSVFGLMALFFGFANLYNIFISDRVCDRYKTFKERLKDIFYLVVIFSAFSFKGTIAVLETIFGKRTPFTRTPKKGSGRKKYFERNKNYIEIIGFLYCLFALPILIKLKLWGLLPWILLFAFSSLYFFYLSVFGFKN